MLPNIIIWLMNKALKAYKKFVINVEHLYIAYYISMSYNDHLRLHVAAIFAKFITYLCTFSTK